MERFKSLCGKVVRYMKLYGFLRTVKKVICTIYYRIYFKLKAKKSSDTLALGSYVDLARFSSVIVFENNFGWNMIMKQRPQQIAENLPDDVLMFYHSPDDSDFAIKDRITKLKENLIILDLGYYRDAVLHFLKNTYNKYLLVYSTDYIPYDRIELYEEYRYKVIYEYVDDLNEALSGEAYNDLRERHLNLLKDDNVYIVSTATKLQEKIRSDSEKEVALITNGVDFDHFKYQKYDMPSDMAKIRNSYKTILCYYGALANWFDYELVKKIAENKDYAIMLLGQDYDNTLDKSGLLEIDNVFFLGRKTYAELPAYGCNSDICMIPFLLNEITESTSPVKLFEYMAMEKPIVTSALPECRKYKSVFFSESHEGFIENIGRAIAAISDPEYKETLIREAAENTWRSKAQNMMSFIINQRNGEIMNYVNKIFTEEEFDRIIVWRSPFGWDVPLFQRPQHIARQFARAKCLVFYEVSVETDPVIDFSRAENNLYLINYHNYFVKQLFEECLANQSKPVYIQIYSTNWSMSLDEVKAYEAKGFKLLYEYIDDISPELSGTEEIPKNILDKYNYVMSNKAVPVVTTAKQIYADVVDKRGEENMVFACNGVDYSFFRDLSDPPTFDDNFLDIVENGKLNVCYYGALASWFDYDLIKKIDATDKYNIILIGIKYDDAYDNSGIDGLENVYHIGPKNYSVLKYFADKMDILTIPFLINSITQATSPLKLFEYMALHKPIVTTAMNECKNYRSVLIGNTHGEFIEMLEEAACRINDREYIELLDTEAKENDWSGKAKTIMELLEKNEQ